jgi:hypothetical protein
MWLLEASKSGGPVRKGSVAAREWAGPREATGPALGLGVLALVAHLEG